MSELSKFDILLHKTHIKVLRIDMCKSLILLSKMAHQMWGDHPFSQRNKITEREVGMRVGVDWKAGGKGVVGGLDKIWKRGGVGMQYRKVFIKIRGLGPLCQLWTATFICFYWNKPLKTSLKTILQIQPYILYFVNSNNIKFMVVIVSKIQKSYNEMIEINAL